MNGLICTYVSAAGIKCDRKRWKTGKCSAHYKRAKAGKDMDAPIAVITKNDGRSCSLSGCLALARARGLCNTHVQNFYWARKMGRLAEGRWKLPVRKVRKDCIKLLIRMPRVEMERLKAYAELRGLSIEDTIVEAALRNIAEWRMRAA